MPANSVGARVHDVWLVNAAVNANIAAYYNVLTPDDTGANWQLRAEWTFLFPTH